MSPELVEVGPATAPRTRWQQPFDAALTDVFQVQADIAGQVASALDVALADSVRQRAGGASRRRTSRAYDAYPAGRGGVAGHGAWRAGESPSRNRVVRAGRSARLGIRSGLGQGVAGVLPAQHPHHPVGGDGGAVVVAANRAQTLAPNRPDGALALGDYYRRSRSSRRGRWRCSRARAQAGAEQRGPARRGGRRGRVAGPVATGARASQAGDGAGSPVGARRQALRLRAVDARRYAEADAAAGRAAEPGTNRHGDLPPECGDRGGRGNLDEARRRLHAAPAEIDPNEMLAYFANFEDLWWLLEDGQQRRLLTLRPDAFDNDTSAWGLVFAQVYHQRGDDRRSRIYADSALRAFEVNVREAPRDAQVRTLMGLAEAYAGRLAEAQQDGEAGVSMNEDEYFGPYLRQQLARIYMLAGKQDKAIDVLGPLLRVPHTLSPGWLRIDPTWDPLRAHPRFKRLVEGGPPEGGDRTGSGELTVHR